MKKPVLFFIFGLIVILLSTPLAYISVNVMFHNNNLTGEYVPIINGFIHSFMLFGTLVFSIGFFWILKDKNLRK